MQQKLHYFAEKDRLGWLMLFCCFGVCLCKSARSAGDFGVSFVQYRLSTLACILPQITQITQRGMQQAALFRRERQVGEYCCFGVVAVLLF